GIATYVWVLTNKKAPERKGKVQLINGANLSSKMRKSLGSKRHFLTDDEIRAITKNFGEFVETDTLTESGKPLTAKIFDTHEFGYRRLTIERPLRLSAQITDEAVESLRFAPKPFNAVMQAVFDQFGTAWNDDTYGTLIDVEAEVRALIKADFPELKEKQIKDVLDSKLWLSQKALMDAAKALQVAVGEKLGGKAQQSDDFNQFELTLKGAFKATGIKFDAKQKKQFTDAITWKNQDAEPVIKKVLKEDAQPLYGAFDYKGKVVEFQQDGDLRDNENVPLDPSVSTSTLIESDFKREVQPHVADAWINADKRDDKDNEIGVVGYEIPFNRHFYVYQPPRALEAIDSDLDAVSADIMKLLQEVHS
ncbi:SAM-dependent DNA methyltransferase, partial [Photobacterium sp. SP02]